MTATDPAESRRERFREQGPAPDPWGVKRAENLLTSLQGILSARVVVSPIGEVTEIHVLTHGGTSPKQVVRNVESALLAQLGVKVDHRKISVAQTAEVKPIEALEESAIREEALHRGVVFRNMEVLSGRSQRVSIEVTLSAAGDEVTGTYETADTQKARLQGAARAAVGALDKVLPQGTLELEGVKLIDAFDTRFALVGVQVLEGRGSRLMTGTCQVQESQELAAVLAALDATNRWIDSRR